MNAGPASSPSSLSYEGDPTWRRIHALLPADITFDDTVRPVEEEFRWRRSRLHVDRFPNPAATHKIILHHGVGTNGRLLSMIVGAPLARLGYEVVAIDMPLYGVSENNEASIVYEDWIDVSRQLIARESQRDGKPIVLYGLSAGGMLCYHVACLEDAVKGVVGMCFLDLTDIRVNVLISRFPFPALVERLNALMIPLLAKTPLRRVPLPMALVSRMSALANPPDALALLLADRKSGGSSVPLGFIASLIRYQATIAPENFNRCPVLLTQPAADRWTAFESSAAFYDRLACRKSVVMLENAGHYPMEAPGLHQMRDAIANFVRSL